MKSHRIKGGNGITLEVKEWGNREGSPVLFLHGLLGNHLAWGRQTSVVLRRNRRMVAMELRGHGKSGKDLSPENYTTGRYWADDVNAVITELGLDHPLLVAWSYGGYVTCDYLTHYGDFALSGINFVCAGWKQRADREMIGPGLYDHLDGLMSTNDGDRIEAMRGLFGSFSPSPADPEVIDAALVFAKMVPAEVLQACLTRTLDFGEVLGRINVPTLVSWGDADTILLPAMAEGMMRKIPGARASVYEGWGHAVPVEGAVRFNSELDAFAEETRSSK